MESGKQSVWLPEESFESFGNYRRALGSTPSRLRNRMFARANVQEEIEIKARSKNPMKRNLTWWDLMWFAIGTVIGAGIFVITGEEAANYAGPSIILSYVFAGISAMLTVFCYTEFAVEIPVAGECCFLTHRSMVISKRSTNSVDCHTQEIAYLVLELRMKGIILGGFVHAGQFRCYPRHPVPKQCSFSFDSHSFCS